MYIIIGVDNTGQFTEGFTINNSKRSALRDSVDQIEPQVECDIYPLIVSGHEIWIMEVKEGEDKPYFCSCKGTHNQPRPSHRQRRNDQCRPNALL